MAEKKFLADIKLVSSKIVDDTGNQISLTKDERNAVSNASGGPATQSNPLVTLTKHTQDLEALSSGIRWRPPVDFVGLKANVTSTAPSNPVSGDIYVNPTNAKKYKFTTVWDDGTLLSNEFKVVGNDSKIYTVTSNSLDDGETPINGARYIDLNSNKIFNFNTVWDDGETPLANWTVFVHNTDEEYTYDLESTSWIMKSSGSIPYASETLPGKVTFAESGEVTALKAVQSNDTRLIKGYYTNTFTNVTGTLSIVHNLGTSKIVIQAWSGNDEVSIQIAKNSTNPTTTVDITVNGTVSSLDVYIIGLP